MVQVRLLNVQPDVCKREIEAEIMATLPTTCVGCNMLGDSVCIYYFIINIGSTYFNFQLT